MTSNSHCSNVILGFHPSERGFTYENLLSPGPAAVFADIIGLTGLFVHAGLFQIKRDVDTDRRTFQAFKVCACALDISHIYSYRTYRTYRTYKTYSNRELGDDRHVIRGAGERARRLVDPGVDAFGGQGRGRPEVINPQSVIARERARAVIPPGI